MRIVRWLSILGLMVMVLTCHAQVSCSLVLKDPANCPKAGDKISAKLIVSIEPGWHISSLTTPDGGLLRTELALPKDSPCKLAGKIGAPEPRRQHSEAFDVDVETYEGEVGFTLSLQARADIPAGTKLVVEITYQACSDETCLTPKIAKVEALVGAREKVK